MITADTYNAPDWVDLTTPDIDTATDFYSRLLGWDLEKTPTPEGDYFIGSHHGHQVGGLMALAPELAATSPRWTMFIHVEDADDTVALVEGFGGVVLEPPRDIPDARIAYVSDPSGATMGLISTPLPHMDKRWYSRQSGAVSWVELLTDDPAGAEGFYGAVFGWKTSTRDISGVSYTTFTLGGDDVAGMLRPSSEEVEHPQWTIYFVVENCNAAEERAPELGGRVVRPTAEIDIGRFAVLEDPQSARFRVMEYKR